jgi:hypothetical protein
METVHRKALFWRLKKGYWGAWIWLPKRAWEQKLTSVREAAAGGALIWEQEKFH